MSLESNLPLSDPLQSIEPFCGSIDIRFPDLGTKEKNVKRVRKFQDILLSYSGINESNDSSSQ